MVEPFDAQMIILFYHGKQSFSTVSVRQIPGVNGSSEDKLILTFDTFAKLLSKGLYPFALCVSEHLKEKGNSVWPFPIHSTSRRQTFFIA